MMRRILFSAVVSCLVAGCDQQAAPYSEETALQKSVSGQKAYDHVAALVAFGPRPAGSEALEKSRVYIEEQLAALGWNTQRQELTAKTPDGQVQFINLRARFGTTGWDDGVEGLLCSHYDTKISANYVFVGANDAGSSTGLLIELARVLAERPAVARKLELVFFDGEEAFGPNITTSDGLYGSRHYSKEMILVAPKKRPEWGLLLDMVGDSDLKIRAGVRVPRPGIREMADGREEKTHIDHEAVEYERNQIGQQLVAAAGDLGLRQYVGISPDYITDDHVPLNISAGIPTIDIIDFDYPYWHTPGDTMERIDAKSLEITGRVTLQLVEKYLLR